MKRIADPRGTGESTIRADRRSARASETRAELRSANYNGGLLFS